MSSKEKLLKIQAGSVFTASLPFEQFVSELCRRYTRIFGEILPINELDYVVAKLEEKGILDDEEDEEIMQPIYM